MPPAQTPIEPTNQIAAVKSTEAMAFEAEVSRCAVAYSKAMPDDMPTEQRVQGWLMVWQSMGRSRAQSLAGPVCELATRIYFGEVAC